MRNSVLMTVGVVVAIGAAFAVPAMSDGPANYNNSAYNLHDDDHATYVARQTDAYNGEQSLTRQDVASNERYGYENGLSGTGEHQVVMAPAEESIDVQAQRLPNGAPVAVSGMVTKISGKNMVIERAGTKIHARLPGVVDERIKRGDDVTVFGRLSNRGDDIAVRSEAVLLRTGASQGHLFLSPSRLETVNKMNAPVSRGEAGRALDHYRYNYTAL